MKNKYQSFWILKIILSIYSAQKSLFKKVKKSKKNALCNYDNINNGNNDKKLRKSLLMSKNSYKAIDYITFIIKKTFT